MQLSQFLNAASDTMCLESAERTCPGRNRVTYIFHPLQRGELPTEIVGQGAELPPYFGHWLVDDEDGGGTGLENLASGSDGQVMYLGIGGNASGLKVHAHGDARNGLIWGRKQWLL